MQFGPLFDSKKDVKSPAKNLRKHSRQEEGEEQNVKRAKKESKDEIAILESTQQDLVSARELWQDETKRDEAIKKYSKCLNAFQVTYKLHAHPPHFGGLKKEDAIMFVKIFLEIGEAHQEYAKTQEAKLADPCREQALKAFKKVEKLKCARDLNLTAADLGLSNSSVFDNIKEVIAQLSVAAIETTPMLIDSESKDDAPSSSSSASASPEIPPKKKMLKVKVPAGQKQFFPLSEPDFVIPESLKGKFLNATDAWWSTDKRSRVACKTAIENLCLLKGELFAIYADHAHDNFARMDRSYRAQSLTLARMLREFGEINASYAILLSVGRLQYEQNAYDAFSKFNILRKIKKFTVKSLGIEDAPEDLFENVEDEIRRLEEALEPSSLEAKATQSASSHSSASSQPTKKTVAKTGAVDSEKGKISKKTKAKASSTTHAAMEVENGSEQNATRRSARNAKASKDPKKASSPTQSFASSSAAPVSPSPAPVARKRGGIRKATTSPLSLPPASETAGAVNPPQVPSSSQSQSAATPSVFASLPDSSFPSSSFSTFQDPSIGLGLPTFPAAGNSSSNPSVLQVNFFAPVFFSSPLPFPDMASASSLGNGSQSSSSSSSGSGFNFDEEPPMPDYFAKWKKMPNSTAESASSQTASLAATVAAPTASQTSSSVGDEPDLTFGTSATLIGDLSGASSSSNSSSNSNSNSNSYMEDIVDDSAPALLSAASLPSMSSQAELAMSAASFGRSVDEDDDFLSSFTSTGSGSQTSRSAYSQSFLTSQFGLNRRRKGSADMSDDRDDFFSTLQGSEDLPDDFEGDYFNPTQKKFGQ